MRREASPMKNTVIDFIKDNIYVILGVLCVIIIGVIYIISRSGGGGLVDVSDTFHAPLYEPQTEVPPDPTPPPIVDDEPIEIFVHIVGEVINPGVFTLEDGARVAHVLEMAGGATEYADLARINLAAFLRDAMQIIVPAIGDDVADVFVFDEDAAAASVQSVPEHGSVVNINTATSLQLQTLPGVGPVLSGNIIEHRETHGAFSSVDELINVSRIGPATLDRLRNLVTV